MADDPRPQPTFSRLRRWTIAFNVGAGLAAALALAGMANYLSARHHWRFQLALHRPAGLAPQTVRVLQSVTNQVKAIIFFDTHDEEDLYALVSGLLREYNNVNPKLLVETVDPARNPGQAEVVLATYRLAAIKDRNFVVFDCDGRAKVIYQGELADYQLEPVPDRPREYRKKLTAFKGESLFTTAIFNLANPHHFKICFTQGHGEHDPEQPPSNPFGYWKFAQALKEKTDAQEEKLSLLGANAVPPDCQLLIIAGWRQPFAETELAKIDAYLKQGGRLLALLSNPVWDGLGGLETVLARWNVGVGDKAILDPTQSPTGNDLLTARLNTQHPVMRALAADSGANRVLLVLPRSVGPLRAGTPAPDAPRVEVLAFTSDSGTERAIRNGTPYPDPFHDRTGVFPLIVAVEQGSIKGVSTERGATRIIVVGDSLCMDNQLIDQPGPCGNHYFATLAADWLLDRPQVLLEGLVPRPLTTYRLVMTPQQLEAAAVVLLVGLPGVVLLLGALVWWRRRH